MISKSWVKHLAFTGTVEAAFRVSRDKCNLRVGPAIYKEAFDKACNPKKLFQYCRLDVPIDLLPDLSPGFRARYKPSVLELSTVNPSIVWISLPSAYLAVPASRSRLFGVFSMRSYDLQAL